MTRWLGVLSATVLAFSATGDRTVHAQAAQHQALTFQGGVALWTMAIKPDKTTDFEAVMAKLRDALSRSVRPERQRQLAGWKVIKIDHPMPDGTIAYVHLIDPVVPGADYAIMQTLYDEFPDERQALYEMYRGAFVKNLSMANGTITVDMSKAAQPVPSPAP